MRSKVRAYSHHGHGPRADHQAGYISATSDSTTSLAKGSRSIHMGQQYALSGATRDGSIVPKPAIRAKVGQAGSSYGSRLPDGSCHPGDARRNTMTSVPR